MNVAFRSNLAIVPSCFLMTAYYQHILTYLFHFSAQYSCIAIAIFQLEQRPSHRKVHGQCLNHTHQSRTRTPRETARNPFIPTRLPVPIPTRPRTTFNTPVHTRLLEIRCLAYSGTSHTAQGRLGSVRVPDLFRRHPNRNSRPRV